MKNSVTLVDKSTILQEKLADGQIINTTYPDKNTITVHTQGTYNITSDTLNHRITILETEYPINDTIETVKSL